MFLTDCPTCGLRELRGARSIELLVNAEDGPEMLYRCRRCATVDTLGTGRRPPRRPRVATPTPTAAFAA